MTQKVIYICANAASTSRAAAQPWCYDARFQLQQTYNLGKQNYVDTELEMVVTGRDVRIVCLEWHDAVVIPIRPQ